MHLARWGSAVRAQVRARALFVGSIDKPPATGSSSPRHWPLGTCRAGLIDREPIEVQAFELARSFLCSDLNGRWPLTSDPASGDRARASRVERSRLSVARSITSLPTGVIMAPGRRPTRDEFDKLLQPRRLAIEDPVERIATGCGAFVGEALQQSCLGRARGSRRLSMPNVALSARGRLIEDLGRAAASGRLGDVTPELAFEFAIGIVLQAMQAAAEGRICPLASAGRRRRESGARSG